MKCGQGRRCISERNHERDNMIKYHNRLGFSVNFTLTSGEVLAQKPDRRIFFPGCKALETEGLMAAIFATPPNDF